MSAPVSAANDAGGGAGPTHDPVEAASSLSRSRLWRLQRAYFQAAGVDAWRNGTVPQYVTSNPVLAHAYAAVVTGWLRDGARTRHDPAEPFVVLEIGSGSGQFGFNLLRALAALRALSPHPLPKLLYVMSDITRQNLEFWSRHPSFAPFIADGTLDFALFDVERDCSLVLERSGRRIAAGDLRNPLLVIANYVFDSIPQDAFAVLDGELFERRMALFSSAPVDPNDPDALEHLTFALSDHPAANPPYPEPEFCALLAECCRSCQEGSLLFPIAALRAFKRLSALSGGRTSLLTADRGGLHQPPGLTDGSELLLHGSISLPVNYHAIALAVQRNGGTVFAPDHGHHDISVLACVPGPAAEFGETRLAFAQSIANGGPDEFCTLRRGIAAHYGDLGLSHLLALLRISRYDPKILRDCLPALGSLIAQADQDHRHALRETVRRCCHNYFRIGVDRGWAIPVSSLLAALGAPAEALEVLEQERSAGEPDARLHWSIGMCQAALGRSVEAAEHFTMALRLDPGLPQFA